MENFSHECKQIFFFIHFWICGYIRVRTTFKHVRTVLSFVFLYIYIYFVLFYLFERIAFKTHLKWCAFSVFRAANCHIQKQCKNHSKPFHSQTEYARKKSANKIFRWKLRIIFNKSQQIFSWCFMDRKRKTFHTIRIFRFYTMDIYTSFLSNLFHYNLHKRIQNRFESKMYSFFSCIRNIVSFCRSTFDLYSISVCICCASFPKLKSYWHKDYEKQRERKNK